MNQDEQYCLLGALNTVGVTKIFEPVILRSIREIVDDKEFCCVESFNDHPETQHRDVVAVLHRARGHIAAGRFNLPVAAALYPDKGDQHRATDGGRIPSLFRKLFG